MKLFISWSGEFSQRVAEKLSIWIPTIIQSVEVFYSPEDIAKGENWSKRLDEELNECSFGIICLTPENVAAPWIHFEAGALSKSLNSRISAIMLGVNPSALKGPLTRYQNTAFEREDFFRLFQSINDANSTPLKPEVLKNAFDNAWEKLQTDVEAIINAHPVDPKPEKDEDQDDGDALQEILRLVRKMDNTQAATILPSVSRPAQTNSDEESLHHAHVRARVINDNADIQSASETIFALMEPTSSTIDSDDIFKTLQRKGSYAFVIQAALLPAARRLLKRFDVRLIGTA